MNNAISRWTKLYNTGKNTAELSEALYTLGILATNKAELSMEEYYKFLRNGGGNLEIMYKNKNNNSNNNNTALPSLEHLINKLNKMASNKPTITGPTISEIFEKSLTTIRNETSEKLSKLDVLRATLQQASGSALNDIIEESSNTLKKACAEAEVIFSIIILFLDSTLSVTFDPFRTEIFEERRLNILKV